MANNDENASFSEYRRLILMGLEETASKIESLDNKMVLHASSIEGKIHTLDMKINTLETKLWAVLGIVSFIGTIVGPILVAVILHFIGK